MKYLQNINVCTKTLALTVIIFILSGWMSFISDPEVLQRQKRERAGGVPAGHADKPELVLFL